MIKKILRFIKSHLIITLRSVKKNLNKAKIQLFRTLHKLWNLVRGKKPEHIVIFGPARSGTTLIYNMLRYSIEDEDVYSPERETPALDSLRIFKNAYVTKRPLDIYSIEEILSRLGDIRDLKFILMVRDPRALVTSMHKSVPWQFNQSWDYGFYIGPYPSYTRPGVGKAFKQIDEIKRNSDVEYKIVRYEDLVADPESIRAQLSDFCKIPLSRSFSEFHEGNIPQKLTTQLNGIRPPDKKNAERWRDPKYKKRIDTQLHLFPEMKKRIIEYGYPLDEVSEESKLNEPEFKMGIVVAMHTPDEVYTNEAKRMRASLDRLGIKHSVDKLPSVDKIAGVQDPDNYPDWFLQKLARYYKPTWLKEKRQQIRGPLLYCDVDAFIHKNPWPYLSLYEGDVSVFSFRDGKITSGTIWFNDTPAAMQIIELWEQKCLNKQKEVLEAWPEIRPSASDQPMLEEIVKENFEKLNFTIQLLPPTLLFIFDKVEVSSMEEVYIEHLQASRVAKSKLFNKQPSDKPTSRDRRIEELENIL